MRRDNTQNDPEHKWNDLPYLAIDNTIHVVLDHWLAESRTTSDSAVGSSKSTA